MLDYFNYAHLITLLATAAFVVAVYFPLRKRSEFAREIALCILMGFNLTQHLFKSFFWPHMWGNGFGIVNTAYNICAILIIATPFVYLGKNALLKQFIAYVGTIGPVATLLIPHWFIGSTILSWEFARFWTCHTLLISTSLIPALCGMVKFDIRDGWKFGFVFLAMISIILANYAVFLLAIGQETTETLYGALLARNPLWAMGPTGGIEKLRFVFEALSPKIFLDPPVPVLWYAVPVYLYITVIAYLLGGIFGSKLTKRVLITHKS